MSKYLTTPVVDAVSAAKIYIDPAKWSKILVHPKSKKPNWLAIHLLSKILYWYKSIPLIDETTGTFLGYKKKFKAHMLQLGYPSIMEQMGCTYQEARDALACLLDAKVVHNPKGAINGRGNIMYIEPIVDNILCITSPKGVHETECLCPQTQIVSVPTDTDSSVSTDTESTYITTCTTSLISTYDFKGGLSVDNSEQLPTSVSPPIENNLNSENKKRRENVKKLKRMLSGAVNHMSVNRH